MQTYDEIYAKVTNPDGDSVTVRVSSIASWADLTPDWRKTYRANALETACSEGLTTYRTGMRVKFIRLKTD